MTLGEESNRCNLEWTQDLKVDGGQKAFQMGIHRVLPIVLGCFAGGIEDSWMRAVTAKSRRNFYTFGRWRLKVGASNTIQSMFGV